MYIWNFILGLLFLKFYPTTSHSTTSSWMNTSYQSGVGTRVHSRGAKRPWFEVLTIVLPIV